MNDKSWCKLSGSSRSAGSEGKYMKLTYKLISIILYYFPDIFVYLVT